MTEENKQQARYAHELDKIQSLKDKLVQFHSKVLADGTNIATVTGMERLSFEFQILLFRPVRIGKLTLIKEISGGETIMTSSHINVCTTNSEKYLDKYKIQ